MTPRERVMAIFSAYEDHAEYANENGLAAAAYRTRRPNFPSGHRAVRPFVSTKRK